MKEELLMPICGYRKGWCKSDGPCVVSSDDLADACPYFTARHPYYNLKMTDHGVIADDSKTYNHKFRNAPDYHEVKHGVMKAPVADKGKCEVCGFPTPFYDTELNCPICSDACRLRLYKKLYEEAISE